MKTSKISYPHPVIDKNNSDYIDCEFYISNNFEVVKKEVNGIAKIELQYHLVCKSMEDLILGNKAKVVLYLESKLTGFRKAVIFQNDTNTISIDIEKSKLGNYLDIKPYILANEDIKEFNLYEHNHEIFNTSLRGVKKGEVLAIADGLRLNLDDYDPLADKPSVFKIFLDNNLKDKVRLDWEGQFISIYINDELHKQYNELKGDGNFKLILASLFVAPALVDVIAMMKNIDEDQLIEYKDKKWYKVINQRLKDLKINLKKEYSCFSVANKILPLLSTAVANMEFINKEIYNGKGEN